MKRRKENKLAIAIKILITLLILGTVGALETERITFTQATLQSIACIFIWLGADFYEKK